MSHTLMMSHFFKILNSWAANWRSFDLQTILELLFRSAGEEIICFRSYSQAQPKRPKVTRTVTVLRIGQTYLLGPSVDRSSEYHLWPLNSSQNIGGSALFKVISWSSNDINFFNFPRYSFQSQVKILKLFFLQISSEYFFEYTLTKL